MPQFEAARQEGAEALARNLSLADIAAIEVGEAPGALKGLGLRAWGEHVENPVSDGLDAGRAFAGRTWARAQQKAGAAWEGARDKAEATWDAGKHRAGEAVRWGQAKGQAAWAGAKTRGSEWRRGTDDPFVTQGWVASEREAGVLSWAS